MADRQPPLIMGEELRRLRVPVAANTTINFHDLCCIDAGFLKPAADTAGAVGGLIALETVDNSGAANGAKSCQCFMGEARVPTPGATGAAITAADLGKYAVCKDAVGVVQDGTETNNIKCGIIYDVSEVTSGWVKVRFFPNGG